MKFAYSFFVLCLLSMSVVAQKYDKPGNYGLQYKRLAADIQFNLPFIDKDAYVPSDSMLRPGALICNTGDTLVYKWTGEEFIEIGVPGWKLSGNDLNGTERLGSVNEADVTIMTNGNDVVTVNPDGEVGVGTPLPFGRMHIHSDNFSNTGYPSVFYTTMNSGGKYSAVGLTPGSRVLSIQNTHEPSIDDPNGGSIWMFSNSVQALVINQDQKVIVGSDGLQSDSDKFQVDGTAYVEGLTVNIASKGSGKVLQSDTNGHGTWSEVIAVMTAAQASAIVSPVQSRIVFVTTTNGTFTSVGWWGYNGTTWGKLNN